MKTIIHGNGFFKLHRTVPLQDFMIMFHEYITVDMRKKLSGSASEDVVFFKFENLAEILIYHDKASAQIFHVY